MKLLKTSFASVLLFSVAAISSAAGNLVVNGSFETADFTGWNLSGNTGFTGVTDAFGATDGSFAAFLGSIGSDGVLMQSQSLATIAGHGYTFSFDLKNVDGTPNDFSAAFNGTSLYSVTDLASSANYTHYSFNVFATSSTSNIAFNFRNDPFFLALDNVSVVDNGMVNSAPAPAALASFGLGLAARLRRRKKA